ncbi:MAG: four helix bundle protein, partial [Gemmatimonadetes bacterium]|nr:four helix bundle protein [Gemmatimonadota bacterium]
YDYYQPEAYVPRSDTYIEKESSINEQIDRMRHSATRALLERDDVIVVASVSCIYGIGDVETYSAMAFEVKRGERISQRQLLADLVALHYRRNDANFVRGAFRVRGDTIEVHPAYEETGVRIELFGDEIERITQVDLLTGERLAELDEARDALRRPFFDARRRYFEHVYENQWELETILDPVITVHPDELSFEAFSKDESSYARLSARHDLFSRIDSFEHGTTNVDFGLGLEDQLDRAATSIVLNIAEGAGEFSLPDKQRFYRMAKRSERSSRRGLPSGRNVSRTNPERGRPSSPGSVMERESSTSTATKLRCGTTEVRTSEGRRRQKPRTPSVATRRPAMTPRSRAPARPRGRA